MDNFMQEAEEFVKKYRRDFEAKVIEKLGFLPYF